MMDRFSCNWVIGTFSKFKKYNRVKNIEYKKSTSNVSK